jgi:Na+-translocating ferredoxin:NAD+ oxidoreductase RnfD subunit
VTSRALSLGGATYPVVLPNVRDPRLHVAAVIISIHVLGQVALGFRVSVPQILAAILTCAVLEIALTFRTARAFVWPASAMLTGSGVALILRVVGTPDGDHWTTYAWWLYAAVAGLSLLSKYVIKHRGSHVFNPSNIGLVVTFLVLGSSRVEPLDFWWAPLNPAMILAYAVILVGGLLITRRLHLLALAAAFWLTLTAGVGILAASGHCMTATWAFTPVCGVDFWRVIVTSPEVLIFLFFMITDPKTVPGGQVGRVVFAILVGVVSTLLLAPQVDEFGTKVGLLAGLVVVCAVRPLLDRILPVPHSAADDLRRFATGVTPGLAPGVAEADGPSAPAVPASAAAAPPPERHGLFGGLGPAGRVGLATLSIALVATAVVLAGAPARGLVFADTNEVLTRVPSTVDPSTLPPISVAQAVIDFDPRFAEGEAQTVAITLAQNLEVENQAIVRRDPALLRAVDHGDRLADMLGRVAGAQGAATVLVTHYRFDSMSLSLIKPFGVQTALSLGVAATGTKVDETVDASGAVVSHQASAFQQTFVLRRVTGARWLNVAILP